VADRGGYNNFLIDAEINVTTKINQMYGLHNFITQIENWSSANKIS